MPRGVFERTKEYRDKISKANKGRIFSEEHNRRISEYQKKRHHLPTSLKTKLKMSKTRKGRPSWKKGIKIRNAHNSNDSLDKENSYELRCIGVK